MKKLYSLQQIISQKNSSHLAGVALAMLAALAAVPSALAQTTYIKAANTTALETSGSWTVTGVPGPGDIGEWNSVATATGDTLASIGGPVSIGEIQIANPAGAVSITDTTVADILTLNASTGTNVGLDMSAATQSLTLALPVTLGNNQTWKINTGRTLTLSGVNSDLTFGASVLTITGGGTLAVNFPNLPNTFTSSSLGAGLVINGATVAVTIQEPVSTFHTYANFFGSNTFLTMTPSTTTFSTFDLGEVANSGNHTQLFTNLTLNPGTSIFNQSAARAASSGCCIGFQAITRNGGSIADFINNGGNAWGGSANDYGLPTPTAGANAGLSLSLGYATTSANDWAAPKGGQTDISAVTYTADTFTAGTDDNVTLTTDTASSGTVNSLRFNTANAPTLTFSGANVITSGGILLGSTLAKNNVIITGGSLTSGNLNADGTSDLIIINNTASSGNLVINSIITDNSSQSVGLTIGTTSTTTPTGSVVLGAANTFSGTTYITKGAVQLTNALALQNSTLNTSLPGTLSFGPLSSATFGGIAGSGSVALPANFALTVGNNSSNTTFAGAISGVHATLTKVGTGTLTLNGASTYSGGTTISAGTLALGPTGSLPSLGGVVFSGGTLDVATANNYSLASTVAGNGTINGSLTLGAGGTLAPTGTSGTLTLNSNLTINGGAIAVSVAGGGTEANGLIVVDGNLVLGSSGAVALNITGTLANGTYKIVSLPSGQITGSAESLAVSGFSQSGQAANLVVNNTSGTTAELDLVVSSYTPQTLVWTGDGAGSGVWNIGGDSDWNSGTAHFDDYDNVTFDNTSANTNVSISFTVAPSSVTINGSQNYTFTGSGNIGGGGTLTDNDSGTVMDLTTNSYAGTTTIGAGTLQVGNGTTVGGAVGTGPVVDNGALVFDLPTGSVATLGTASGSGALTNAGAGTVVLNGADTLSGITAITAGTLRQGTANVLPNGVSAGNMVVSGTLDLNGGNATVNGISGPSTGVIDTKSAGNPTLTVLGAGTYSGLIQNSVGTLALALNSSGTFQLGGANTYSGGSTVTAGTLQQGVANAFGSGDISVATGATLDLDGFSSTFGALNGAGTVNTSSGTGTVTLTLGNDNANGTFSGVIESTSGTLNLAKSGTGTEILSGTSTFLGSLTGNAGTLQLNAGAVINITNTLGGQGFVVNGGSLTVAASSTFGGTSPTFTENSGSASFGTLLTSGGGGGFYCQVLGGTFSSTNFVIGRGNNNLGTALPAQGSAIVVPTTDSFYVNGATAKVDLGYFTIGGNGANATGYARVDNGLVIVTNEVIIGITSSGGTTIGGRFNALQINQVAGGTTVFSNMDLVNGIVIAPNDTASHTDSSELYLSGGTTYAHLIQFGLASDAVTGEGLLVMSNATLYLGGVGTSGMSVPNTHAYVADVWLNSGTLGAWYNTSNSVPIVLTGTNFIFQTADNLGNPWSLGLGGAISGGSAMTVTGGGTLYLGSSINSYSGGTAISNGIVNFVNGGFGSGQVTNFGGTIQWAVGNNQDISGFGLTLYSPSILDVNGNNIAFGNPIGNGGSGSLTVTNSSQLTAGSLTLDQPSAYAGNTTVAGGAMAATLFVSGAGTTGSGSVTVGQNGNFGGNSTITTAVTVLSGGTLAPGVNNVGTLTVGALTLNSGSTNAIAFGVGNSSIAASTLTLNDASDNVAFALYEAGTILPYASPGTYTLVTYGGTDPTLDSTWTTSSGSNPHIGNPDPVALYSFAASGGKLTLTIVKNGALNVATWTASSGGNWSTAANWNTSPNIPHAVGDTATFGVGTGSGTTIVTLDEVLSVGGMTFTNANGFDIAAATVPNTLTINNGGGGANIAVLAGVNTIATPMALSDTTEVAVTSGSQLALTGTIANSPSVTKSLVIDGAGTTIISAANSYGPAAGATGTTLSGGGLLQLGNGGALGAGNLSVSGSDTLQAGASMIVPNRIATAAGASLTLDNNSFNLTLSGNISGSGSLNSISGGQLALSGSNSLSGTITVNGGVLSIGANSNVAATSSIILNGGDLLGNNNASSTPSINTASIGIAPTTGTTGGTAYIDAAAGTTFTLSGTIGSAGNTGDVNGSPNNLAVNGLTGTGTVVLNGVGTFFGTTTIGAGALELTGASALADSTLNYNPGGGTFEIGTNLTAASLGALEGSQNLGLYNLSNVGVNLTVGANDSTTTYTGNFTDNGHLGSLTKTGSGDFAVSGISSYGSNTTVTAGTLEITSGSINTGYVSVSGALTADGGNLTVTNASVVHAGGVLTSYQSTSFLSSLNGLDEQDADFLITCLGGTLSVSNMALGRGALVDSTQPTAGDTASGLYVQGGSVVISNNLDMGDDPLAASSISVRIDGGSLTVNSNLIIGLNTTARWSVVDVNGGILTVTNTTAGINVGSTNAGNAELLVRAGVATAGIINLGQKANNGETAVVNVTGGALYLGSGGIVQVPSGIGFVNSLVTLGGGILGATNNWSSSVPITLTGSAATYGMFQTADMNGVANNITLTGGISGTGPFALGGGSGTLSLSGKETWTGGTLINQGTLALVGQDSAIGFLQNTTGITNDAPGIINATGLADGTLHVGDSTIHQVAQSLSGNGTNIGAVLIGAVGTLAPGYPVANVVGFNNYTITAGLTVASGGAVVINIDHPPGNGTTNDMVTAASTAFQSGSSLVVNQGANDLSVGDVFQLFNITGNTGLSTATNLVITLPTTSPDGTITYGWDTSKLAVNGSIKVAPTVNPTPTNIVFGFTNNTLTLSWPFLGWELQTNSINIANTNDWFVLPGSATVTNENIAVQQGQPQVFFRLFLP